MELAELEAKTLSDLQAIAKELELPNVDKLRKHDLAVQIIRTKAEQAGLLFKEGILDILPEGFGFLRTQGYLPHPNDVYVSQSQIKRFGLRTGDTISGQVRPPRDNERYFSLLRVEGVNGGHPDSARIRTTSVSVSSRRSPAAWARRWTSSAATSPAGRSYSAARTAILGATGATGSSPMCSSIRSAASQRGAVSTPVSRPSPWSASTSDSPETRWSVSASG